MTGSQKFPEVRWLSDDRNVFLGEELLHNKRCVARCVIVMQKPLSLPLVTLLPPKHIAQPLQKTEACGGVERQQKILHVHESPFYHCAQFPALSPLLTAGKNKV
jgi:hypothetical protein